MFYTGTTNNTPKYDPAINNDLPIVSATKKEVILFIILGVITLGLFTLIFTIVKNNMFRQLQIEINESASNIDVQLQKRYDTLIKLTDIVKGHVNLDKEVFTTIAAYRSGMDLNQKSEALSKINSALTMSFENYPTLGSNESIRTLNNESIMIEKEIAASRRLYNARVTYFNSQIYLFPNNVILRKLNYKGIPLFVTNEMTRKDVNTSF